jgi:hypothetical protein
MAPREITETLASAGAPLVNGNENTNGGYSLLHPDYHFKYWNTFLLFATMGAGASWVSPILLKLRCELFSIDCDRLRRVLSLLLHSNVKISDPT